MTTCLLCRSAPAEWIVQVGYEARDSWAVPGETPTCGRCKALIEAGSVESLAAVLSTDFAERGRTEVARQLVERATGSVPLVELPSSVLGREQGFSPLAEFTGMVDTLGPLWPERDRISREALGDTEVDPDDRWLVRSPWPSLDVREVLEVLWPWVERDPYPHDPVDWERRVLEVFRWDEQQAVSRLNRFEE